MGTGNGKRQQYLVVEYEKRYRRDGIKIHTRLEE
jgi:hypothetical protein